MRIRETLFAVASTLIVDIVHAADVRHERYLIPVIAHQVEGVAGSTWQSALWAYSALDSVFISPVQRSENLFYAEAVHEVRLPVDARAEILDVYAVDHERVTFTLRVSDTSRLPVHSGAEIPVVPVKEFHSGELNLIAIPAAPAHRVALRVYAAQPQGRGPLRLQILLRNTQRTDGHHGDPRRSGLLGRLSSVR